MLINKVMKLVLWTFLIIFLIICAVLAYWYFSPSETRMRSIETGGYMSLWGDHTNLGHIDAFGFNLKDRYETEYLIGWEHGFDDRVSIHVYEVKESHIEPIRDLFKKNNKYFANKDFSPLCHNNRYSEKTTKKSKAYVKEHCKENNISNAECVVFAKFSIDDYKDEICLFDKYLQFYWGEM